MLIVLLNAKLPITPSPSYKPNYVQIFLESPIAKFHIMFLLYRVSSVFARPDFSAWAGKCR